MKWMPGTVTSAWSGQTRLGGRRIQVLLLLLQGEAHIAGPGTGDLNLPGSPGDAFGGGFGRLADGSGIAGSRRAGWAGGFR
jgi:hypothetical protein